MTDPAVTVPYARELASLFWIGVGLYTVYLAWDYYRQRGDDR